MESENNSLILNLNKTKQDKTLSINSKNLFNLDSADKQILNEPKHFLGYYKTIISKLLKDRGFQKAQVVIGYDEEYVPNNSHPAIYLLRGALSPEELSIPGGELGALECGYTISPEQTNLNPTSAQHLLNISLIVRVFSANRAELENISYQIFLILLATSNEVIGLMFPNIQRVHEPSLGQITPAPKHDNYYFTDINWNIEFVEDTFLLLKENVVKYTNLIIKDKEAFDEIK